MSPGIDPNSPEAARMAIDDLAAPRDERAWRVLRLLAEQDHLWFGGKSPLVDEMECSVEDKLLVLDVLDEAREDRS